MVEETMFKTMMQNSHNYTSLQRLRKVSLKCNELNPKKKKMSSRAMKINFKGKKQFIQGIYRLCQH